MPEAVPPLPTDWQNSWKLAWQHTAFRIQAIVTFPLLVLAMLMVSRFLDFAEGRAGTIIIDPILNMIEPVDVSWITFGMIYAGMILGLFILSSHPQKLLLALQAYPLLMIVRCMAMYTIPLEPPPSMIVLKDPFVEFFSTEVALTKDLFFSGHTSTMFIAFPDYYKKLGPLAFWDCYNHCGWIGDPAACTLQHRRNCGTIFCLSVLPTRLHDPPQLFK